MRNVPWFPTDSAAEALATLNLNFPTPHLVPLFHITIYISRISCKPQNARRCSDLNPGPEECPGPRAALAYCTMGAILQRWDSLTCGWLGFSWHACCPLEPVWQVGWRFL